MFWRKLDKTWPEQSTHYFKPHVFPLRLFIKLLLIFDYINRGIDRRLQMFQYPVENNIKHGLWTDLLFMPYILYCAPQFSNAMKPIAPWAEYPWQSFLWKPVFLSPYNINITSHFYPSTVYMHVYLALTSSCCSRLFIVSVVLLSFSSSAWKRQYKANKSSIVSNTVCMVSECPV